MTAPTLCETCDLPIPSDSAEAVEVTATAGTPYRIDFCSIRCALVGIEDRRREVEAIRRATGTDDPAGPATFTAADGNEGLVVENRNGDRELWNPCDQYVIEDHRGLGGEA